MIDDIWYRQIISPWQIIPLLRRKRRTLGQDATSVGCGDFRHGGGCARARPGGIVDYTCEMNEGIIFVCMAVMLLLMLLLLLPEGGRQVDAGITAAGHHGWCYYFWIC